MRLFSTACLCILSVAAVADEAVSVAGSPTAAAIAASPVAAVMALSPVTASAAVGALSSTAAAMPISPVATVLATARPTPEPFKPLPGPESHVSLVDPSWAVALKAGGALPLGDLATYNQSGPEASLDLYYHADASFSVDAFTSYLSEPYRVGGGSTPLSAEGAGVKLLYNLGDVQGVIWYLGGGIGAYYVQRTQQVLEVPVLNNTPVYDPTPNSSFGLGLMGVLGGRYEFDSALGIQFELNILNINLAGGTSGNMLVAEPVFGVSYSL